MLRIIAQSSTELQPVLDAIATSAVRLCAASDAVIGRLEGDRYYNAAHAGTQMKGLMGRPLPLTRQFPGGRAILDRTPIIIDDLQLVAEREYPDTLELLGLNTVHSLAAIPLLSEGKPLGSLGVLRAEVRPFTGAEVALLQTFADQAVIAIENVRLFTELQEKNRALTTAHAQVTEALDQQTATSEILGVISRSPTEVQPVFDAIAGSAVRLCDAVFSAVLRFDGELLHLVAHHNFTAEGIEAYQRAYPIPLSRSHAGGRAVLDRAVVLIPDVDADSEWGGPVQERRRAAGVRCILAVPMLRDGRPLGTIHVVRRDPKPFSDKQIALLQTFADQAVIAIENVRLFEELETRNRDLTEALEQQTATSEILRVISSSPTDVHPIFDAIANSARRLTGAVMATVYEFDGSLIHLRVLVPGDWPHAAGLQRDFPRPAAPDFAAGRVILERAVFHREDLQNDPDTPEMTRAWARRMDTRGVLWVPLLRESSPIGVIGVARGEPGLFPDKQVRLLQTFADQAVIAIENVRLFTELQEKNRALTVAHAQVTEALEQQTATSEILRVISSSLSDVQPVFDAVARSAARLCEAPHCGVWLTEDGLLRLVAYHDLTPRETPLERNLTLPLVRGTVAGRSVIERRVVQVADLPSEIQEFPEGAERSAGYRTILTVPLLREGASIGGISLRRREARPFSDQQIELLKTFADQAVIAIENVRLFKELQGRNRDLTEALERQTATSEILRVIASSPTDVQPVFDTIVRGASRLCGGEYAIAVRFDGALLHLAAQHNARAGAAEAVTTLYPRPASRDSSIGRAVLDREPIHLPDVRTDPEFSPELVRAAGLGAVVAVPMLREGQPIGAIAVSRETPGPFSDTQIALLQTFADQAVIAIENVRLFQELEARNRELTEALNRQTATAEILRVISHSQTEVQPVFDAIVDNAMRLFRAWSASVILFDGRLAHLGALRGGLPGSEEYLRGQFPVPIRERPIAARCLAERTVVHIPDIESDDSVVDQATRDYGRRRGYRSALYAPMLRDGQPVGTIAITRAEAGPFSPGEIELLQTFADQAVIAIENARLLSALKAKNADLTEALEQQTATNRILQVIASSPTDIKPVFDAIIRSAVRLCDASFGGLLLFDGEQISLTAHSEISEEELEVLRTVFPYTPRPNSLTGRAILERRPVQIDDVRSTPGFFSPAVQALARYRTGLAVPMLREGAPIGGLALWRSDVRRFTDRQVELIAAFANQAVIAIENVRLFQELERRNGELTEALDRQTATAEILRVISQSQTGVQPVFDAIVDNAMRLFRAWAASVFQSDGQFIHLIAAGGGRPGSIEYLRGQSPWPAHLPTLVGRCIQARMVVHIPDIESDPAVGEVNRIAAHARGWRSFLAAPMLRDGQPIGVITIMRAEAEPFSPAEIALLQTFADQAVIAIENVRLFKELEGRNKDLGEALERQTAPRTSCEPSARRRRTCSPCSRSSRTAPCGFSARGAQPWSDTMARWSAWWRREVARREAPTPPESGSSRPTDQPLRPSEQCSRRGCSMSSTSRRTRRAAPSFGVTRPRGASARSSRCQCSGVTTPSG